MGVDRRELQDLIHDLQAIPPALRVELQQAFRRAGQPVLGEMRANSSWSTRIPGAISIQTPASGLLMTFRVNSGRAPHARPYEHDGSPGEFRAPLYGDREWWYPHAARPFFYGAVERNADRVVEQLGDAVMDVAHQHGF